MAKGTITIRTEESIEQRLTDLAQAMDRSKNWVIEEAIKQYLDTQAWQVEGIQEAQQSLANGKGIEFEKVMSGLQAKINYRT